jgi:hypothetical protein
LEVRYVFCVFFFVFFVLSVLLAAQQLSRCKHMVSSAVVPCAAWSERQIEKGCFQKLHIYTYGKYPLANALV